VAPTPPDRGPLCLTCPEARNLTEDVNPRLRAWGSDRECAIGAKVTMIDIPIGDRVIIHPGARVGY
jgi:hypothetical protein